MNKASRTVTGEVARDVKSLAPCLVCIIVHYGDHKVTRACLQSLAPHTKLLRIIVVCNTNENEALALATEVAADNSYIDVCFLNLNRVYGLDADIFVVHTGSNFGFAYGCNVGLRCAANLSGVLYVWILNNDTVVEPGAVTALLRCLDMHPRAVIGTAVVNAVDPQRLELALGCRFNPLTTVIKRVCDNERFCNATMSQQPRVDYVYGASFAFDIGLVAEIGPFCDDFFLYYEEFDFCLRAWDVGYVPFWCPEARVLHRAGSATYARESTVTPQRIQSHYHENLSTFIFLYKHYRWAMPSALVFRTLAKLVLLPFRCQSVLLPSYFAALRDFFHFIWRKR